jgi:hypothetical protein
VLNEPAPTAVSTMSLLSAAGAAGAGAAGAGAGGVAVAAVSGGSEHAIARRAKAATERVFDMIRWSLDGVATAKPVLTDGIRRGFVRPVVVSACVTRSRRTRIADHLNVIVE